MKLRREQIILLKRANKSYKIIIKFFQYTVFVQADFSIGNCDVSQLIASNHHGITVIHCIVFYHSFLHWVFGIYNLWWISENSWMHQLSNTNLLGPSISSQGNSLILLHFVLLPQSWESVLVEINQFRIRGDQKVFLVASYCLSCPVKGTIKYFFIVYNHKFVMHEEGGIICPYCYTWCKRK